MDSVKQLWKQSRPLIVINMPKDNKNRQLEAKIPTKFLKSTDAQPLKL